MRVGIGIILIVTGSTLFTLLLPEDTAWIMLASPFFVTGFVLVYSKIQEMEDNITYLEVKLNELNERERKIKNEIY